MKNNHEKPFERLTAYARTAKTIAFRAVPVGRTQEFLTGEAEELRNEGKDGYIPSARKLADDCVMLTEVADNIHKRFINETLNNFRLKAVSDGGNDSVEEYVTVYLSGLKKADREKELSKIAVKLKKQIAEAFAAVKYDAKKSMLDALTGDTLVKELIRNYDGLTGEQAAACKRLTKATGYFRPYSETRERMYSASAKGHTIPNRTVDDNLPIFIKNMTAYNRLPEEVKKGLQPLWEHIKGEFECGEPGEVFTFAYAAFIAPQKAIDAYNALIGGVSVDDKHKLKGVNELINEYNNSHKLSKKQKIGGLAKLKKQILTERETLSWLPPVFKSDSDAIMAFYGIKKEFDDKIAGMKVFVPGAKTDLGTVWVKANQLNYLSKKLFDSWNTAEYAIKKAMEEKNPRSPRKSAKAYYDKLDKDYKAVSFFSVADVLDAVNRFGPEGIAGNVNWRTLAGYVRTRMAEALAKAEKDYAAAVKTVGKLKSNQYLRQQKEEDQKTARFRIRRALDQLIDIKNDVLIFSCGKEGPSDLNEEFYGTNIAPWEEFGPMMTKAYNSIRNYISGKQYSTDKIRLYFGSDGFLGGWDINKEKVNRGVLMKEGGKYYLGVVAPHCSRLFESPEAYSKDSPLVRLRNRNLDVTKQFKRMFITTEGNHKIYHPSQRLIDIAESHKDDDKQPYTREETTLFIDHYKKCIQMTHAFDIFGMRFRETESYANLKEFYEEAQGYCYKTWFDGVSKKFVRDAVRRGDLLLFEITCQDMSPCHHGKDGNYKVILEEIMSERNTETNTIHICGGAAVYYRPASLKRKVTHPKGVPIANKNPHATKPTRTLNYDLYKDRRYMEDRYMFHLPVEFFSDVPSSRAAQLNDDVKRIVREDPGMYVLGINRGERNLVSIAVTAPDGTIVEQKNLNVFDGFDYREKLDSLEKERNTDRRSWDAVRKIKNVKEGYLSRAVGEIIRLVKKYNCIVAMENLDMEFRRGRQKFEKNVYQQFESAVIGKLGFLMDKDDENRIHNVKQLTITGKTVQDRLKYVHNGVVLLVCPSWITMTTPGHGFVTRLNTYYENLETSIKFVGSFTSIKYNRKTGRFQFDFRNADVVPGKETGDGLILWRVETNGERIDNVCGANGVYEDVHHFLTDEMAKLLDDYGFEYRNGEELKENLMRLPADGMKRFYEILRLTLRNTSYDSKTGEYRVVSCVADSRGRFFDTRTAGEGQPKDADVNAAWNIARKAHMVLRGWREDDKAGNVVSDKDWFAEIQK